MERPSDGHEISWSEAFIQIARVGELAANHREVRESDLFANTPAPVNLAVIAFRLLSEVLAPGQDAPPEPPAWTAAPGFLPNFFPLPAVQPSF